VVFEEMSNSIGNKKVLSRKIPPNFLAGWGRLSLPGTEYCSQNLEDASKEANLFRGMGRSYGDSSLPPAYSCRVVNTCFADRIRFFDRKTGRIRAEAV
jgi:hypothetical protein